MKKLKFQLMKYIPSQTKNPAFRQTTLKKFVAIFSLLAIFSSIQAQNTKYPIVLIPDSLYTDIANVSVQNNIYDVDTGYNFTPLYSNTLSLTDTNFFQYLGVVVFDTTDSVNSTMHGYRFI